MSNFIKSLACTLSLLAAIFLPNAHAAVVITTTGAYSYSMTVAIAAPKGSAAEIISKDKNLPVSIEFSPCAASKLDQFIFTIKYDAGKTVDDLQSVYLIFNKPDTNTYGFYPLVRRPPIASGSSFKIYSSPQDMVSTDTYVSAASNLGGAQTEIILGGSISMETLSSGLWMLTAIIAPEKTVNFDDPSTWSAWDVVPFLLRKPWLSPLASSKTNACE